MHPLFVGEMETIKCFCTLTRIWPFSSFNHFLQDGHCFLAQYFQENMNPFFLGKMELSNVFVQYEQEYGFSLVSIFSCKIHSFLLYTSVIY